MKILFACFILIIAMQSHAAEKKDAVPGDDDYVVFTVNGEEVTTAKFRAFIWTCDRKSKSISSVFARRSSFYWHSYGNKFVFG